MLGGQVDVVVARRRADRILGLAAGTLQLFALIVGEALGAATRVVAIESHIPRIPPRLAVAEVDAEERLDHVLRVAGHQVQLAHALVEADGVVDRVHGKRRLAGVLLQPTQHLVAAHVAVGCDRRDVVLLVAVDPLNDAAATEPGVVQGDRGLAVDGPLPRVLLDAQGLDVAAG